MLHRSPRIVLVCLLWLVVALSCRTKLVTPELCTLIGTTDQLDAGGKLTDQTARTFTYSTVALNTLVERNTDRQAGLITQYDQGGSLTSASSSSLAIALEYAGASRKPFRATALANGVAQSVFELLYEPGGKLVQVNESRKLLFGISQTTDVTYSFGYDVAGNLLTERIKYTLLNKATVEQETDFSYDATTVSPYATFPERVLLTVTALALRVETMPGRFWQQNAMTGYKQYAIVNATGARGNLRESAVLTVQLDADKKRLVSQQQDTQTFSGSNPTPQIRRNQHTFLWKCNG